MKNILEQQSRYAKKYLKTLQSLEKIAQKDALMQMVQAKGALENDNIDGHLKDMNKTLQEALTGKNPDSLYSNIKKIADNIKTISTTGATATAGDDKDLGGQDKEREFRTLGVRAGEFKEKFKDFFTMRGFLDKTGIAERGSGGLLSEHLDKAEYKKKGFVGIGSRGGASDIEYQREQNKKMDDQNDILENIEKNTGKLADYLAGESKKPKAAEKPATASGGIIDKLKTALGLGGAAAGIKKAGGMLASGAGSIARGGLAAGRAVVPYALPAAIAYGAANTVDYGFGKLGVGKDEKGNDKAIDEAADEQNWKDMSFGEKLESGLARGIEKIGSVVGLGNIAREARASRIESETKYLNAKSAASKTPKPGSSRKVESSINFTWSDATFAKNDPEGYQEYRKRLEELLPQAIKNNPPKTKSNMSKNAAQKRAMMEAERQARIEFYKRAEAAGAAGGMSATQSAEGAESITKKSTEKAAEKPQSSVKVTPPRDEYDGAADPEAALFEGADGFKTEKKQEPVKVTAAPGQVTKLEKPDQDASYKKYFNEAKSRGLTDKEAKKIAARMASKEQAEYAAKLEYAKENGQPIPSEQIKVTLPAPSTPAPEPVKVGPKVVKAAPASDSKSMGGNWRTEGPLAGYSEIDVERTPEWKKLHQEEMSKMKGARNGYRPRAMAHNRYKELVRQGKVSLPTDDANKVGPSPAATSAAQSNGVYDASSDVKAAESAKSNVPVVVSAPTTVQNNSNSTNVGMSKTTRNQDKSFGRYVAASAGAGNW